MCPQRTTVYFAVNYDVGVTARIFGGFGVVGLFVYAEVCFRYAHSGSAHDQRRMCRDAHVTRVEITVAVKNEKIGFIFQQSDSLKHQRKFPKCQITGYIRHIYNAVTLLFLDDFAAGGIYHHYTADCPFGVALLPVGEVYARNGLKGISRKAVLQTYFLPEVILYLRELFFLSVHHFSPLPKYSPMNFIYIA